MYLKSENIMIYPVPSRVQSMDDTTLLSEVTLHRMLNNMWGSSPNYVISKSADTIMFVVNGYLCIVNLDSSVKALRPCRVEVKLKADGSGIALDDPDDGEFKGLDFTTDAETYNIELWDSNGNVSATSQRRIVCGDSSN